MSFGVLSESFILDGPFSENIYLINDTKTSEQIKPVTLFRHHHHHQQKIISCVCAMVRLLLCVLASAALQRGSVLPIRKKRENKNYT